MATTVIIVMLALVAAFYVAVPLLFPDQADVLPDARDPVAQDLEEERDALFRAIRELDAREDLAERRREELRARYEAKAARVLRALDERRAEVAGAPPPTRASRPRRTPVGALTLLGLMVLSAAALSGFILPRVGANATVTSFFTEDLEASKALQSLQRQARRDPSETNLLALADAYWSLQDAENAETTYRRIAEEITPAPAIALRRLAFLALSRDLDEAATLFEQAAANDPADLDSLFALGEVRFAQGDQEAARAAWEAFLAQPEGAGTTEVEARLELLDAVGPLLASVEQDGSETNLLALADAYWQRSERERAVEVYFRVLTQVNPDSALALGRTGQLLFTSGRAADALVMLERARDLGGSDATTLLMLGNAYFGEARYQDAIAVWEEYLAAVGETEAGRVPDLIASARARLEGGASAPSADALQVSDERLFTANCATCHGALGQGGAGPQLIGNPRAADRANVISLVRFGRGNMPGFGGQLDDDQIARLADYVVEVIAAGASSGAASTAGTAGP